MSKSLIGGAMSFAVALIGLLTVIYAAGIASDGADSSANVVQTVEPILQTALSTTPYALIFIAAISLIGGVGWMLKKGGRGRGVRR